jgi:uncharacterized membrane protein YkoI
MNKQHHKILTALFTMVIMTATTANVALAGESKEKEAKELKLFSEAKISLTEAIKAAEHSVGGKAMEAELDDESNTVQFEIEVLKGGKIHEVLVDGITGKVIKVSLEDEADEGTEKEKE